MRSLKTYTFRVPGEMTARLDSGTMRSWLKDFLANRHALRPDPGSGEDRVSLTLPSQLVKDVARILGCSSSSALRRIAGDRLSVADVVHEKGSPKKLQSVVDHVSLPNSPSISTRTENPVDQGSISEPRPSPEQRAILVRADKNLPLHVQTLLFNASMENRGDPIFREMGGAPARQPVHPGEREAFEELMRARQRELQVEKDKLKKRIGASG